jgi:hypothetical protein
MYQGKLVHISAGIGLSATGVLETVIGGACRSFTVITAIKAATPTTAEPKTPYRRYFLDHTNPKIDTIGPIGIMII